ncbi:hypothetical protein DFR50_110102 [Roseiarcus fermentans]|uniref:Uncharacterized protein n=1 Tax=Roseiarcus fermentans TaxID=1473586 RepID=A0A366FHE0_9HYPH|nr:hypothetical protein [Roseiarcus fermentans]RBP14078.1 hypothetical protein DFR50_110102 [Roseiarcus fermentans]
MLATDLNLESAASEPNGVVDVFVGEDGRMSGKLLRRDHHADRTTGSVAEPAAAATLAEAAWALMNV